MPGMEWGMPGMAGMPGLNETHSDPEVLTATQDPEINGGLPACGPEASKYVKI